MNRERQTRSEQREAARARSKQLREQHKKSEKRKRVALKLGVGGAVFAIVGLVTFVLISGANKVSAVPTNMLFNNGIKIGTNLEAYTDKYTPALGKSGTSAPNIQIYVDYQCPVCQAFELPNSSQIDSWVKTGTATVQIHPISFLDGRGSPNEYSSRAANAAICVAEYSPNSFFRFHSSLFKNQPSEGAPGPDNNGLFETAKQSGITNETEVKSCIDEKRFGKWISDATAKALNEKVPGTSYQLEGTPFVMVNNQVFRPESNADFFSPARFAQFVQSFLTT